MAERPVEHLPLRELFTDADRLTRDLIVHLEQGFIPKVQQLNDVVQVDIDSSDDEEVPDLTVRLQSGRLFESEEFSKQLFDKIDRYYAAIDGAVEKITEV